MSGSNKDHGEMGVRGMGSGDLRCHEGCSCASVPMSDDELKCQMTSS